MTLVALLGWTAAAVQAISFVDIPASGTLRVLQAMQLLGALAVIPAALAAWQAVRTRRGAWIVVGRVLVVVALVGDRRVRRRLPAAVAERELLMRGRDGR
ncbi:hypothetical protein [Clavibacter zhangzhiyongii]|uniref:hypothetical protein n=1 Tax=Clavibacter zhangzhiyongii TaxID=2768071 RepID=UPI0039E1DBC1